VEAIGSIRAKRKFARDDFMSRILLTGATGFVGSAVADACRKEGYPVRTSGRSGKPALGDPEFMAADLSDPASIPPLLEGVTTVIHSAGLAHQVGKQARDVDAFSKNNIFGTENLARAAAAAGVRHFVLLSSVSVYGAGGGDLDELTRPVRPDSPYGESKAAAERRAVEICRGAGMGLTILRLATVYGEKDPGNVLRLIRSIDRGRFFWIGSGRNQKSLVHRDDVARACVACLQAPPSGTEVYDISGPPCTMREIVDAIAEALGRKVPAWRIPESLAGATARCAALVCGKDGWAGRIDKTIRKWLEDNAYGGRRFQERFGVRPLVGLREGLQREVAWYRTLGPDDPR
jgi:nucleoside-diphosphate-sugar epimerase